MTASMEGGAQMPGSPPPPCGAHVGIPDMKVTCVAHERKRRGRRVITAVLLLGNCK